MTVLSETQEHALREARSKGPTGGRVSFGNHDIRRPTFLRLEDAGLGLPVAGRSVDA